MYQVIGMDSKKVYAQGSRADCSRLLNQEYPYITSGKSRGKWGRGDIVTDKPIFNEPLRIVRLDKPLMGGE